MTENTLYKLLFNKYIRKIGLICILLFCSSLIMWAGTGNALSSVGKPNIILIMTDDQGWGDTGYNGHPHLKTPNLDKMSREGITFTRFYSAAAMCSPTRASAYLGRHPYRTGITFAMKGMLEEHEIPITTFLKKAGYTTGHFGKWHMGTLSKEQGDQRRWGEFARTPERYYCPPWDRDVDVSFVTESKVPTWDPLIHPGKIMERETDEEKGLSYGNEFFTGPGVTVTENMEGDASRVVVDRVIPFINNAVETDTPFFAVVWFHTPHSPVVGGEKYMQMYGEHPIDVQHYYACLTAMDEQVGRLRAQLDNLGVDENTMIWFCSDNGPARQNSPRHHGITNGLSGYKLSINEGGIRVPGLLVWPAMVKKPFTIEAPAVTTDYLPTVLDVLDIPLPDDRIYDGISLLPLIQKEKTTRDSPIGFLNREGTESAWMKDRYKLLVDSSGIQLYDIQNDPAESTNLSSQYLEKTANMLNDLLNWKTGVMDELNQLD